MTDALVTSISQQIKDAKLSADDLKVMLKTLVAQNWPELPLNSPLTQAQVIEYPKVTVSTGVAIVFKDHGITKTGIPKLG